MSTYYHNPRCSKSRQGLAILEKQGTKFTIKEYLKEKMTKAELKDLFSKLAGDPISAIRTKETTFKELGLSKDLTANQWIEILVKNPILLERPILVTTKKAIIGRPPENFQGL